MTYDNEGRTTAWQNAQSSPTSTEAMAYDGEGNRVALRVNGGTPTYYLGDLEEISGTTLTKYLSAGTGGLQTAVRVGTGGSLTYLAADGLGSISEALDGSGNVTLQQLFTPYGTSRYSSGSSPTTFAFTGQRADSTAGLDYYNARYYDPVAGQFASADTVQDGLNRYAYVGGNPETLTDPSGHCFIVCLSIPAVGGGLLGDAIDVAATVLFPEVAIPADVIGGAIVLGGLLLSAHNGDTVVTDKTAPRSATTATSAASGSWLTAMTTALAGALAHLPNIPTQVPVTHTGGHGRTHLPGHPGGSLPTDLPGSPGGIIPASLPVLGGIGVVSVLLPLYDTLTPSKVLGKNLTAAGLPQPAKWWAAHHIVAHGELYTSADAARKILAAFGIDINDADNGVWLDPTVHNPIHTNLYDDEVNALLQAASKAQGANAQTIRTVLRDIAKRIQGGNFP